MKRISLILLSLLVWNTHAAQDLTKEMDALGANKDLMRKARAVDPENRIRVVQNRDVDRYTRLEIGVNGALNAGGDPYTNSSQYGGSLDFHITPRWSVGGRFNAYSNSLTNEGDAVYKDAVARRDVDPSYRIPDFDWAKNSWLAVVNWYPIYGKLNLFDAKIAQFDIYGLVGAGQINLRSGSASLYSAGGGVGIWLSQHFSTRLEARWQGYQDRVYTGARNINQTILGLSIGFLL